MPKSKIDWFAVTVAAAENGDTDSARSLLIYIRSWLPEYAARTPDIFYQEGIVMVDKQVVEYLYSALCRLEDGDSAGKAFLLTRRRGAPKKLGTKEFDIAIGMRNMIDSGHSQNKASENLSEVFNLSVPQIKKTFRKVFPSHKK